MKKRTEEEIKLQIDNLQKEKLRLPKRSMFGNDNHGLIDAQIAVLKGTATPDDFYIDESAEEYSDGDNDIYFAAEEAKSWLDGNRNDDLF